MNQMSLVIEDLTFEAAHYIPGHQGKCKGIHGHTYFIRDFEIVFQYEDNDKVVNNLGMLVDFGKIKDAARKWDHAFIVPHRYIDLEKLKFLLRDIGADTSNIVELADTTVETMIYWLPQYVHAEVEASLRENNQEIAGVYVCMTLCEGPRQGAKMWYPRPPPALFA